MKYFWLILPIVIVMIFLGITDIDPVVADTQSYLDAAEILPIPDKECEYTRPPIYPLMLLIFGKNIILIQTILWLVMAFLLFRKFGVLGLILYSTTIGLLFLSQKMLSETFFIFFLALAVTGKKNMAFVWICIATLVRPVTFLFLPLMLIDLFQFRMSYKRIVCIGIGLSLIIFQSIMMKIYLDTWQISTAGTFNYETFIKDQSFLRYLTILGTNTIGKTVGVEGLFLQRITQLQVLSYTFIALIGIVLWVFQRKIMYLLPIYIVLVSGLSPNQGDRYHIVIVPVCIMILYDLFSSKTFDEWKQKSFIKSSLRNLRNNFRYVSST